MASSAVGQEKQIDYIIQNILSFQGPTALFALLQGVFVSCDHFVQMAHMGVFLKLLVTCILGCFGKTGFRF